MKPPLANVVGLGLLLSAAALRADSYKEAVMADKPFAYYRLSEASNTDAVADEIGNNPGAYINKPKVGVPGAIVSDPKNTAVALARSQNQYIKLTSLGNYGGNVSSGFSVEYWLKTANSTDHQNVFGTANSPEFITDFLVDIAYGGSTGRLRIYCRDNHANRFQADYFPMDKNIDIFDDQWHHLVHVYDPKAKEIADQVLLYIDGQRQTLSAWRKGGVPEFSDFNDPMTLGAMNLRGDISDSLDGSLDEVAFYTNPLSAAQILRHYQAAGKHLSASVPVAPRAHDQLPFVWPHAPTPIADANPFIRHREIVKVPIGLVVERTAESLSITEDRTHVEPTTIQVGYKMVTGLETRQFVYPEDGPRPSGPGAYGLGPTDFNIGTSYLYSQTGGIPKPGKSYVVEIAWTVFETDIPGQHMWSPTSGKYKALLAGTLKQIVGPAPGIYRARPPASKPPLLVGATVTAALLLVPYWAWRARFFSRA